MDLIEQEQYCLQILLDKNLRLGYASKIETSELSVNSGC